MLKTATGSLGQITTSVNTVNDLREVNVISNRPDHSVCISFLKYEVAPDDDYVYGTREFFKKENVSLGFGTILFPIKLKDGEVIHFPSMQL